MFSFENDDDIDISMIEKYLFASCPAFTKRLFIARNVLSYDIFFLMEYFEPYRFYNYELDIWFNLI